MHSGIPRYSQLEIETAIQIEIQIQMDKHTQDTCGTWMTVSCNCCRGIWLPLKQLRQSPLMAMMMKMKMKLLLSDKGIAAMETAVART